MRFWGFLLLALAPRLIAPLPVAAQQVITQVYEYDIPVDDEEEEDDGTNTDKKKKPKRDAEPGVIYTVPAIPIPQGIASFGPFRVLDGNRAALVAATDSHSPAQFRAMLAAYPGLRQIDMIDCPGTVDDQANLALGRMIHARGMATYVPDGGSVRSGGVELFLAGARKFAAPGARFAVHSWADNTGKEARDYAPDAPENRAYLNYYRDVGLTDGEARAFYEMTKQVPFRSARHLSAAQLKQLVGTD